ncbi:MAG TPA: isovaleryl-CoA dehydrogenase [Candidatus Acidoferrum sp.]|nr:isovaleryl-CoA dehydrogenase [Candidatus Acidoferrum sp.]
MKPTSTSEPTGTRESARKTHEVLNQPPPLKDYNLYLTDTALVEAVRREGADWAAPQLRALGEFLGTEEAQRWGFEANENEPVLRTHDRYGYRRDEVEFHPSWHKLVRTSIENRLHSLPWLETRTGAHVARAALLMLTAQNEVGHTCPISMTFSAIAALRADSELAAEWEPRILSPVYDPRVLPAPEKSGVLVGMGMTEKQGGSDVRANTTRAERVGNSREYLITGHKWFCSAPMCDGFLILAQAPKGLSCFLLPRWTPAGERNALHLQRLKRKMGNRSNASSEVEFEGACARLVGEEGRGVQTIIEMVNCTRLDCAVAATALMRAAVVQAVHHAKHRRAFGKLLIEQPLMQSVLADLIVESEAATLLAVRVARAFDALRSNERERSFARIATAIGKYWLCKRAPTHVGEALECLGGNGYVEESIMPRLYREAPLYSIWEGSGNVVCLDVLRTLAREPQASQAMMDEILLGVNADTRLKTAASELESILRKYTRVASEKTVNDSQCEARRLTERAALLLQASLLLRHGAPAVADAFIASRLCGEGGWTFGTLPAGTKLKPILERVHNDFAKE